VLHVLRSAQPRLPEVFRVTFEPERVISVATQESRGHHWCAGKNAILCSAIGHVGSFRSTAEELKLHVLDEVTFEDHHRYTGQDVDALRLKAKIAQADIVLTTEKDAAKLTSWLTPADPWWAVRLSTRVNEGEERLREHITDRMKSGRTEVCA
jgi:tetraacyldisaccharide 4'-kinase